MFRRPYAVSAASVLAVLAASVGAALPAAAVAGGVTLAPANPTVAPLSPLDLTASTPVAASGTFSQEIVQTIDPTKVNLTAVTDIAYPAGWTLSYSTDGTTFSATAPANAAAWAAVRAVKATGNLVSSGSDGGRQVAQSTASGTGVSTSPATLSVSGSVDGFQVFFDADRTRAFNIYHHQTGSLDCWVVSTGVRCPGFPYVYGGYAAEQSIGRVVGSRIWIPGSNGLYCVDISTVLTSSGLPTVCSGGQIVGGLLPLGSSTRFTNFTGATALGSAVETRLYAVDSSVNPATAYCVDTATKAACTSIPTSIPGVAFANDFGNSVLWDGRLYIVTDSKKVTCVKIDGSGLCPGWSSLTSATGYLQRPSSPASPQWGKLFELPDSSGATQAVCMAYQYYAAGVYPCWDAAGVEVPASTFNFPQFTVGTQIGFYGVPVKRGSKLYFGNGVTTGSGEVLCYDAAANSGAGGRCNGAASNIVALNYTVTPDPLIDNCLWITAHSSPVIQTRNLLTGSSGCSSLATMRATFAAATTVPRMGCSASDSIQSWKSFLLNSASGTYSSATLTVKNSSGTAISGWAGIPITAGAALDLSSLSVATTGSTPSFVVDFAGASGSIAASASVAAVGAAPQLCLRVTAQVVCPASSPLGPLDAATLVSTSAAVTGSGSSTAGGVTTTFASDSQTVTVSAPSSGQCGSTLSGRAGDASSGASGSPVAGATVSLLTSAGVAVTYPSDYSTVALRGLPVTATTDASGNYSFGYLAPGSYKVSFASLSTATSSSATVASGAAGSSLTTSSAVSGTSTSAVDVLAVGSNGVVNGLYVIAPVPAADTSLGKAGVVQTITPLANDTASTGATYSGGSTSIKLCSSGQSYPTCTATTLVVSGQGSYAVSGANVTFTPCTGAGTPVMTPACTAPFTGTASAVTYQSSDSLGRTGTSTITPTVAAVPTAGADTSTGVLNTVQTITPLANDSAGTGTTLTASSVRLCTAATANASCTGTTLNVAGEGTYTANANGTVSFAPCQATGSSGAGCTGPFAGAATPIKYVVSDALGQTSNSTISASVTVPSADVATADTTIGVIGAAQTIDPLANDTAPTGVTLKPTTVRLCTSGQSPPGCTGTSLIVSGKGVYTVNTATGVLTFTPCNAAAGNLTVGGTPYAVGCTGTPFTGTPTAATYQVTDNLAATARTVSSTYTPTVVGTPTAAADSSSGAFGATQTISPLLNDAAATGGTLSAASVRVCASGTAAASCTGTTYVSSGKGVFTANSDGTVSFVPCTASGVPDASCTVPFYGSVPAIGYRVTDSLNQNVVSTITVSVSAPPADVASADTSSAFAGVTQSVNPLTNDTSPAGVSLVVSSVKLCTGVQVAPSCTGTTLTNAQGTYSVNPASGVISFAPCTAAGVPNGSCTGAFTGTATPVAYQVSDNLSTPRVISSTYTPTVIAPPQAVNDSSSGAFGQPQTIDVLHNDTVDPTTTFDDATVFLCGTGDAVPTCNHTSLTVTGVGVYTVNANGTVTFTPDAGYYGTPTAVTYQVSDGLGQTTSATIAVTVSSPTPPNATDDTRLVLPGDSVSFRAVTGTGGLATPGDGALVPASTCLAHPAPSTACDATVSIAGEGVWVLDAATGVVTFTADPSASVGALTPIDYRVYDSNGQFDIGSLTPVVPAPPVADDDYSYGEQGQTQSLIPTSNDAAGDVLLSLDPTSVLLCDVGPPLEIAPNCTATSVTISGEGTYTLDPANGRVTFIPVNDAFTGPVTPVAYQIADELGQVSSAALNPYVLPRPAPHATNDVGSAAYGNPVTLAPLVNDTAGDVPSDGSVVSSVVLDVSTLALCAAGEAPPLCTATTVTTVDGSYVLNPVTLAVAFTPATGFSGTVISPVQYQIANSYVQMVGATPTSKSQVTSAYLIPTIGAPTPPAASDDSETGLVNNPVILTPIANDLDGQRDLLIPASLRLCDAAATPPQSPTPPPGNCTATLITIPGSGTLSLDPSTGVLTFTPEPDWTGTLSVPYVVADTSGGVVDALVDITINAPTAAADTSYGIPGETQVLSVLTNDAPATGTATTLDATTLRLCASSETVPSCTQTSVTTASGTYTITAAGQVSFVPAPGTTSGSDSIDYVIRDSMGEPASATLTVAVVPPPVPSAANDIAYAPAGQPVTFSPWGNDTSLVSATTGPITYTDGGLAHTSVTLCASGESVPACTATSLITVDGTYTVDPATGEVTFTAATGFTGTATAPVTYQIANPYTVNSGSGSGTQYASATLTPVIVAPPAPSASDDTGSAAYDHPVVFTPWSNDAAMGDATTGTVAYTDAGFDHTSVLLCDTGEIVPNCTATTVTTSEGTYAVDVLTGEVTFTPVTGFTGTAQFPVRYQMDDAYTITNSAVAAGGARQVVSALLTPTIGPLAPPTAVDDAQTTALDTPVRLAGATNDTAGSYPIDVTSVLLCGAGETAPACTQTVVALAEGTFTVDVLTGEVTFEPADGWSGTVTIPYVVSDTHAHTDDATLTVTITPPTLIAADAADDRKAVHPGSSTTLTVLTNDTTDPIDPFRASTVLLCDTGETAPHCTKTTLVTADGTWTVVVLTGEVTFTPAPGFRGQTTAPYQVSTHTWRVVDALITVWVVDPPAAVDDSSSGDVGQTQVLDPFGNDAPDSDAPFVPSSLRLCGAGEVLPHCTQTQVVTPDGTYTIDPVTHQVRFRPAAGFTGDATPVYYQVSDEAGQITGAWLRPHVRAGGGGGVAMGTLRLSKTIVGGSLRTGEVVLVAECSDRSGHSTRIERTIPVGVSHRVWDVSVRAGMSCSVTETRTGVPRSVTFVPTLNGKVWKATANPRLAIGAHKPLGVTAPIRALRLDARGGCSIEAGLLIGQVAGACTVTWTQPDGQITSQSMWTKIERGRSATHAGTQSSVLRIRAGQTVAIGFTNTYVAHDIVVSRSLRVSPSCGAVAKAGHLIRGALTPCKSAPLAAKGSHGAKIWFEYGRERMAARLPRLVI